MICAEVGWTDLKFVPHSLRYGGAVYWKYVRQYAIEEVRVLGRWVFLSTCEVYMKRGIPSLYDLRSRYKARGRP